MTLKTALLVAAVVATGGLGATVASAQDQPPPDAQHHDMDQNAQDQHRDMHDMHRDLHDMHRDMHGMHRNWHAHRHCMTRWHHHHRVRVCR